MRRRTFNRGLCRGQRVVFPDERSRERVCNPGQLSPAEETPWSLIARRASPLDAFLLAVVPAVLLGVYALPTALRHSLALEYTAPTLLTMYASHFVHLTPGHLAVNLLGYVLVISTVYLLSVANDRRRRFVVVFATFLLAFPFALSGLNLLFARPTAGVGFSGIVLAFLGYLPLTLGGFIGRHLDVPVDSIESSWLFFFGFAFVSLMAVPGPYGTAVAAAAFLAGVLFLLPAIEEMDDDHLTTARGTLDVAGNVELTFLGVLVFVGYLLVAFPPTTRVVNGGTLNVYTHALGFSLGYVVTYLTVLLGDIR